MGWLEDIGGWWDEVTGAKQQREARANQSVVNRDLESLRAQEAATAQAAASERAAAMQAVQGATRASVQDYLRNMAASAQPMAESQVQNIATQGTRQALMAGKTGGLPTGQAALAAGRQAGDLYSVHW